MIDRNTSAVESQLNALSPASVTSLVCQALGGDAWSPLHWRCQRLTRSAGGATGGVFRVEGTAQAAGQVRAWSLILKVVSPAVWLAMMNGPADDPSHPLFWKREVLAYQSGWLDHLPGGLRAPRSLGVDEQPNGAIWLWLEDAQDSYEGQWPVEQYVRAARCLGRFNGAYLAGQPWPPYAWLSRTGSPRGVIEHHNWIEPLVRNPATWAHPLLRRAFPASLVARLPEFWEQRHILLDALERLPQTVCHQDAWRGNCFAPSGAEGELVMIDWAYVGRAVVGTDLGDLAVAGYPLLPPGLAPAEIDEAVFAAFMDGLRDAGWQAKRNQVRFAYVTCAALKYGCLLLWLRDIQDETRHAVWEQFAGQPMDIWLGLQLVMLEHQLGLLDEARGLLPLLESGPD